MTLVAAPPRHVVLTSWRAETLAQGSHQGTQVVDGVLTIGAPAGTPTYEDPHAQRSVSTTYEWAAWVSPQVETAFAATEVLPSWNAETPRDSWLLVEARTATDEGGRRRWSPWFALARWADSDREIHPTSVPGQGAVGARVHSVPLRLIARLVRAVLC